MEPPHKSHGRAAMRLCVLLTLLVCAPMAMRGATFVQSAFSIPLSAATVTVTYPSAQTAGDLNVVVVGWNDTTSTVKSVTDSSGNVYQLAIGPTVGTALEQSIYYAPNIAGGSNTVTVTFSQAAYYPDIRVLEYQGVSAVDVAVGSKGKSLTSSSGAATRNANELIVAANTVYTYSKSVASGYTLRVDTSDGDFVEDKIATKAGSNTATVTLAQSGQWVMQMVAFSASTASAQQPTLSGISCSTSSFTGPGTDACTVSLSGAAATGGFAVSLGSNNSAVTVPSSVTVAAGASTVSFTATVSQVSTAQTATLTASASGTSKTFAITLGAAVPSLGISVTSLSFGNVNLNSPANQSVTLTSTGAAAVTVNSATAAGSGFAVSGATFPATLNPGQTLALNVQFDPTVAGAATGTLTISSTSSTNPTATVGLSGTGVASAALSGLTCASGSMTGAGTDACTVSLSGAAATGGFAVSLSSNNSAVTVPSSVTVAAGASTASFTSTIAKVSTAQTATLTASVSGTSKTFAIALGAAVPGLSINASSVSFGSVNLNAPTTQSLTLTSCGTAAVTVNSVTVAGSGFTVSGATFPLTLNAGQTLTLNVQFDPTVAGSATGTLTIASTSSTNPTATISLSGTGVALSYEVELSWNAPGSSSDPVTAYNVYRAPSGSTSYQKLNTAAITVTSYTDTTVQLGQTYDYVVESVDCNGVTSAPSNMAAEVIP